MPSLPQPSLCNTCAISKGAASSPRGDHFWLGQVCVTLGGSLLCCLPWVEVFSVQEDHAHTGRCTSTVLQGGTRGAGAGDTTAIPPSPTLVWQPGRGAGLSFPAQGPQGSWGLVPGGYWLSGRWGACN